jgi:hypothetical protein
MKRFRSIPVLHSLSKKLSTIVLWFCMLITTGIFVFFYIETINDPDKFETIGSGFILNWLYIIFILSLSVACIFSFIRFFIKWKKNPKSFLQSLIMGGILILLLICTYVVGNGEPLPIAGYEGVENTSFWLKLTDMWLYTLYVLLALTIIALWGGIVWSYFKRTR